MKAKQAEKLISAYLDRQLPPARASRLEAAVRNEADLARRLEAQRRFHSFLRRALANVAVPEGLTGSVRERLAAKNPATGHRTASVNNGR
jgi:anti-sigma factor RsiW